MNRALRKATGQKAQEIEKIMDQVGIKFDDDGQPKAVHVNKFAHLKGR